MSEKHKLHNHKLFLWTGSLSVLKALTFVDQKDLQPLLLKGGDELCYSHFQAGYVQAADISKGEGFVMFLNTKDPTRLIEKSIWAPSKL